MGDDRSPIYSHLAGDEDIGEIVMLYAEEMLGRAARLRAGLDAENWEDLKFFVHQLKGSAGSHGFTAVAETAVKLDKLLAEFLATNHSEAMFPKETIIATTRLLIDLCLRVTGEVEKS